MPPGERSSRNNVRGVLGIASVHLVQTNSSMPATARTKAQAKEQLKQTEPKANEQLTQASAGTPLEPRAKHTEQNETKSRKNVLLIEVQQNKATPATDLLKNAEESAKEMAQKAQRMKLASPVESDERKGIPKLGLAGGNSLDSRGIRLYSQTPFEKLANHGREAPETHAKSVSDLVKYLIKSAPSDEEKAWVIYSWVCHHIRYDVDGLHGRAIRQSCKPGDVLQSRLSVCAGYAGIFEALAANAGLTVRQVSGHARNCSRRVGQDVIKDGVGAHAWNAVKLEDQWILIDCTWGAGTCTNEAFQAQFRPHFFGVPPDQLAFSHFPSDTLWQLLERPVSYNDFINQPIVCTDSFFQHHLSFIPFRRTGFIKLEGSLRGSIELNVPENVSVMGRVGELETTNRRTSPTKMSIEFKTPSGSKVVDLKIFVRHGSPYGQYGLACILAVQC